jgi:hypothetical protein
MLDGNPLYLMAPHATYAVLSTVLLAVRTVLNTYNVHPYVRRANCLLSVVIKTVPYLLQYGRELHNSCSSIVITTRPTKRIGHA